MEMDQLLSNFQPKYLIVHNLQKSLEINGHNSSKSEERIRRLLRSWLTKRILR